MDKYERAGKYIRKIAPCGVCFRCSKSLQYICEGEGVLRGLGNNVELREKEEKS